MRPLALLLILAACGGKNDDPAPAESSPAPAAAAAAAPAPAPAPTPAPAPPPPAPAAAPEKKAEPDPQLARKQALEAARSAGIPDSAALQQGGAFASLTGTGDISSGFDDKEIYGGLLGDEVGEMKGGFGYGLSGTGQGGGGTGIGTIGTGSYGTIGHGSGTGSGYGRGGGLGSAGRASSPTVVIGNASATGDLDKNIIRRYIRRKLPQIRYCYERELASTPELQGKVVADFVIAESGNVSSSTASGLHPDVDSCIADAIRTIQFPRPKAGQVKVSYPFIFRPADPPAADASAP